MDAVRDLALSSRPKILFCGGTAIPRTIDFAGFAEIAGEAGALMVADVSHIAGLIAGGAHPSPIPHAGCGDDDYPQDPSRSSGGVADVS